MSGTTTDLLRRAGLYLEVTHKTAARHDVMGEGHSCAGCALLGKIRDASQGATAPQPDREQEDLAAQITQALEACRCLIPIEQTAAILPVVRAAEAAAVRHALEAADAVQSHPGAIPFRPQLDEDGGFWWDTRDRDAAAALIRARASAVASPAREEAEGSGMACSNCETAVEWINCPTGGWWAHRQHPDDGHDASPMPTSAVESRGGYSDLPARAFMENRCLLPPHGCGRTRTSRDATGTREEEWTLTGLCPDCQDARATREQGEEQQPETTAAQLARITTERDELLAELAGRDDEARERWIQKNLDETRLRSIDFRNGAEMAIEPARELLAHWVAAARAVLGNAPNYSETLAMDVKVAESPERYSLVVQRLSPDALTPHQARQKAEAALSAVLGIVSAWCTEANNVGGLDAGDLAWRLEEAGHPLPDEEPEPTA